MLNFTPPEANASESMPNWFMPAAGSKTTKFCALVPVRTPVTIG